MRLFIAIDIPEDIKKQFIGIIDELKQCDFHVRWVRAENLHITLKFLGHVNSPDINKLSDIVRSTAEKYKSFHVECGKLNAFPDFGLPKVLYVNIDDGDIIIKNIYSEIETKYMGIGFEKGKKPYSPHLTIGRFLRTPHKNKVIHNILKKKHIRIPFRVKALTLYESKLTGKGPVYTVISSSEFK